VSVQPEPVGNLNAAKDEFAAFNQTVNIVTYAGGVHDGGY
jgi:hypothetical protein